MKKVLTVILSCFLVLGLTACGSNDSLNSGSSHSKSSSSSYKTPIENYCQGASKQDLATFKKAFDDIVLRVYAEDIEQDFYDAVASTIEDYGTYTMTCEVGKITYEATAEDLQELNDYYEQEYGESVSFTAGYSVEVKATISGSLDEDTETDSVDVVKYNGKWYILDYFSKKIHTSTAISETLKDVNTSYLNVAESLLKGIVNHDYAMYRQAFYPQYGKLYSEEDFKERYFNYEDLCGSNLNINYQMEKPEKASSTDLQQIIQYYSQHYQSQINPTEGYFIKYHLYFQGDEDQGSDTYQLLAGKIGDKWYVLNVENSRY